MGNKQKIKTNNNNNQININNQISNNNQNKQCCYLLCPKCWNKVPYINTFIEGDNIKIKILCSCLDNNSFLILDLPEYINLINNRKIFNPCIFHKEITGAKFCMNCENWLCENCSLKHTEDKCNKHNNNIKNNSNLNEAIICLEHNKSKKIFFCKKCQNFFCKECFRKHELRNKKKHKGINIEYYITKEKIKIKKNKLNEYKGKINEVYNNINNELLKGIDSLNHIDNKDNTLSNEDLLRYKKIIKDKYLIHKKINQHLHDLIELILINFEYFDDRIIFNRKYICNVIMNASINLIFPKLNKELTINEQIKLIINFLNINYINNKINCKLNLLNNINKSLSSIEMLLTLPENKFVSINKDCIIQIWDIKAKKIIYTLQEHTNNITSIILLKNKKYFSTASDDSTIKIWDFSTGKCIKTIITEGKPFLIYELYNKENQIGCIPYRNSLAIYDYNESSQKQIINISLEKSISWIEGLYQLPNDGRIILSTSGFFQIFSPELVDIKKIYIANDTPQIFLQLNNKDFIVGFLSKEIYVYNNDFKYKTRLIGHKKSITSILEFCDNKILTSSLDSNIILWSSNDYEMISSFINNNNRINGLIIIDKNRIITNSYNKESSIDEWELEINSDK
jgi:WD40 repeat protein